MDELVSLLQIVAFAAPIGLACAWMLERGGALSQVFVGTARDSTALMPAWPHGVQEDDDVTWSFGTGDGLFSSPLAEPGTAPADDAQPAIAAIEELPEGAGPDTTRVSRGH